MKKSKVISATGTNSLEQEINQWLNENSDVDIISVSYSTTASQIQSTESQTLHAFHASVLIIFEEKRPMKFS